MEDLFFKLTTAPKLMKYVTSASNPFAAAICSGVFPYWSVWSVSCKESMVARL